MDYEQQHWPMMNVKLIYWATEYYVDLVWREPDWDDEPHDPPGDIFSPLYGVHAVINREIYLIWWAPFPPDDHIEFQLTPWRDHD